MKVIKRLLIFGIIFTFFCTAVNVQAASKTLGVRRVEQQESKWCWAACSEMVGKYGTSSKLTQRDAVRLIWGDTYPNKAGTVANMVSCVQYISDYKKKAKSVSCLLSLENIKNNINAGKPMIGRISWTNGDGHAVVFSGYNDAKIRIVDPAKNKPIIYLSYNDLKSKAKFKSGTGKITHTVYY